MSRPLLLDLYCCAGGAGMGYRRAGFDVIGVDVQRPTAYPAGEFRQADALGVLRQLVVTGGTYMSHRIAAVHASPPCQTHSALTKGNRRREGWSDGHVDLVTPTRELLEATGLPYVIENVQGAPVRRDLTLCGEMFGLAVIRHRYFELGGWSMLQPPHQRHRGRVAGWRHGVKHEGPYFQVHGLGGGKGTVSEWQAAMGMDWTEDRRELAEAIPPAYTEFVGGGLLAVVLSRQEYAA